MRAWPALEGAAFESNHVLLQDQEFLYSAQLGALHLRHLNWIWIGAHRICHDRQKSQKSQTTQMNPLT